MHKFLLAAGAAALAFAAPASADPGKGKGHGQTAGHSQMVKSHGAKAKHGKRYYQGHVGANFWGKGILKTAQLILLIDEAARFQAIAAPLGGAKDYTPGALELQWSRTGLLEKARAYEG